MLVLASVVSFLATLSLASSVGGRAHGCPSNGALDVKNFTLLAVHKTNTSDQEPLALAADGSLIPTDAESGDTIITKNFFMKDGGITAYTPNGTVVAVSDVIYPGNSGVGFIPTDNATAVPPGKEYCMLLNPGSDGKFTDELAVNGHTDLFMICQMPDTKPFLIFKAASPRFGRIGTLLLECYDVDVYMLLVDPQ
ncbi:hypothetical protein BJV74DRAFT_172412 [Russula compacta]|nr:hypothetical protein BJV74DRAFT_172412 [Russula compacta]